MFFLVSIASVNSWICYTIKFELIGNILSSLCCSEKHLDGCCFSGASSAIQSCYLDSLYQMMRKLDGLVAVFGMHHAPLPSHKLVPAWPVWAAVIATTDTTLVT